jgi:hypothetical protein
VSTLKLFLEKEVILLQKIPVIFVIFGTSRIRVYRLGFSAFENFNKKYFA